MYVEIDVTGLLTKVDSSKSEGAGFKWPYPAQSLAGILKGINYINSVEPIEDRLVDWDCEFNEIEIPSCLSFLIQPKSIRFVPGDIESPFIDLQQKVVYVTKGDGGIVNYFDGNKIATYKAGYYDGDGDNKTLSHISRYEFERACDKWFKMFSPDKKSTKNLAELRQNVALLDVLNEVCMAFKEPINDEKGNIIKDEEGRPKTKTIWRVHNFDVSLNWMYFVKKDYIESVKSFYDCEYGILESRYPLDEAKFIKRYFEKVFRV